MTDLEGGDHFWAFGRVLQVNIPDIGVCGDNVRGAAGLDGMVEDDLEGDAWLPFAPIDRPTSEAVVLSRRSCEAGDAGRGCQGQEAKSGEDHVGVMYSARLVCDEIHGEEEGSSRFMYKNILAHTQGGGTRQAEGWDEMLGCPVLETFEGGGDDSGQNTPRSFAQRKFQPFNQRHLGTRNSCFCRDFGNLASPDSGPQSQFFWQDYSISSTCGGTETARRRGDVTLSDQTDSLGRLSALVYQVERELGLLENRSEPLPECLLSSSSRYFLQGRRITSCD